MIEGMIYGLIGAWLLSLFGVDKYLCRSVATIYEFHINNKSLLFRIWICWYDMWNCILFKK